MAGGQGDAGILGRQGRRVYRQGIAGVEGGIGHQGGLGAATGDDENIIGVEQKIADRSERC